MSPQLQAIWERQLTILYGWGNYTKDMVKTYVPYFITEEAYQRITGEPYTKKVS